jgi:hypothetical protein
MKLNKALHGLKQAPLSCNLHLEKMFDTVKIIKAPAPCLYTYNNCTIVVYVDDLIIIDPSVEGSDSAQEHHKETLCMHGRWRHEGVLGRAV